MTCRGHSMSVCFVLSACLPVRLCVPVSLSACLYAVSVTRGRPLSLNADGKPGDGRIPPNDALSDSNLHRKNQNALSAAQSTFPAYMGVVDEAIPQ